MNTHGARIPLTLLVLAALAALGAQRAHAQVSFTPVQCSACPTMTTVPNFTYSSQEFADEPNGGLADQYNNYLNYNALVWANRNVRHLDLHFSSFDLERGYDYFGMRTNTTTNITGVGPGWYGKDAVESFQVNPMTHTFTTDYNNPAPGFVVDQARVCCASQTNEEPAVNASLQTNMGVLLGTNDVVYLKVPRPLSIGRLRVSLRGATGTDFDLYARCNAKPTPSNYTARANSGDSMEFIELTPSQCTTGSWYLAVHSYRGAGRFDVRWAHGHDARRVAIKVGIRRTVSALDLQLIALSWARAVRQLYGATEGQVFIHTVDIYNGVGSCTSCNGSVCDVCYRGDPGTGYCCNTTYDWIAIDNSFEQNYEGIAHELLHKYLSVWDEYYHWDGTTASLQKYDGKFQCGHSNLADGGGSNNNLCTASDHRMDAFPGVPATSQPAVWPTIRDKGKVVNWWSTTPDNYDYIDHDFNGAITIRTH